MLGCRKAVDVDNVIKGSYSIILREVQVATPQEQFIIDARGRKTAVILSFKRYQRLMEDLHDLSVIAERRDEKAITLEELKRQLKEDGVI